MMFIIIAAVFYAVAIVCLTVASRHLNTNLAAGIVNFVSALLPIAVAAHVITKKSVTDNKFGILIAVLGGTCIAVFGMALSKSYSVNKAGIVSPLVFGGAIIISTILSYIILKEKISAIQGVGLIVVAVGLALIVYARATGK